MSRIEAEEIAKLTKLKFKSNKQSRQSFLKDVIDHIEGMPDDDWNQLSDGKGSAQEWANSASDAKKAGEQIPDFPDLGEKPEAEADEEETTSDTSEEAQPTDDDAGDGDENEGGAGGEESESDDVDKKTTKKKGAKPAKETAVKKATVKKAVAPKKAANGNGNGARSGERVEKIWDLLMKNPNMTAEQIAAKTEMKGSTVSLAVSRFHRLAAYLHEKGAIKTPVHATKKPGKKSAASDNGDE